MRVLALDVGERRTGVAISDPTGTLARPLRPLQRGFDLLALFLPGQNFDQLQSKIHGSSRTARSNHLAIPDNRIRAVIQLLESIQNTRKTGGLAAFEQTGACQHFGCRTYRRGETITCRHAGQQSANARVVIEMICTRQPARQNHHVVFLL